MTNENQKQPDEALTENARIKALQAQLREANKAKEEAEAAKIDAESELKKVQEMKSISKGKHEHDIRHYKDINYHKPWFEVCGQLKSADNRLIPADGDVLARRNRVKVLFKGGIGVTNNREAAVELSTTLQRVYIVEHAPMCPKCGLDMEEDIIANNWYCPDVQCDTEISMKGNKR